MDQALFAMLYEQVRLISSTEATRRPGGHMAMGTTLNATRDGLLFLLELDDLLLNTTCCRTNTGIRFFRDIHTFTRPYRPR
jgi:hypothetical protein